MAEFKGIKQVLKAEFEQTVDKVGYIWFVRESTASTTGEVYLGSRLYGTSEPVPSIEGLASEQDVLEAVSGKAETSAVTALATAVEGKQDTLTAGENIVINGNTISATASDPILEESLTVGNPVGYLATGVTYSAGTSIEQILRDMLIASDETLNVTLAVSGNGSSLSDVTGATVTVTYGGQGHVVQNGTIRIPANTQYTVSVSSVNDYDTPADQVYTSVSNGTRNITFTYAKQQGGSPSDVYAYYGSLDEADILVDDVLAQEWDYEPEESEEFSETNIKNKLTKSTAVTNGSRFSFTPATTDTEILVLVPTTYNVAIIDTMNGNRVLTNWFTQTNNVTIDGITYKGYRWYVEAGVQSLSIEITLTNA